MPGVLGQGVRPEVCPALADHERMLELLSRDESYVSLENLSEVLRWCREEQL